MNSFFKMPLPQWGFQLGETNNACDRVFIFIDFKKLNLCYLPFIPFNKAKPGK